MKTTYRVFNVVHNVISKEIKMNKLDNISIRCHQRPRHNSIHFLCHISVKYFNIDIKLENISFLKEK